MSAAKWSSKVDTCCGVQTRVRHRRVTIVKDRQTRQSKGVAFILFLNKEDAVRAVAAFDGREVLIRTAST